MYFEWDSYQLVEKSFREGGRTKWEGSKNPRKKDDMFSLPDSALRKLQMCFGRYEYTKIKWNKRY